MTTANPIDVARIDLLLAGLRLAAIKLMWAKLAEQADKEGWPAVRFLAALAEHEIADRGRRRIERHLAEARLPIGKTLQNFEFEVMPMVIQPPMIDPKWSYCLPAVGSVLAATEAMLRRRATAAVVASDA